MVENNNNGYKDEVVPFSLSIDVTHRCNLRCRHCYNESGSGSRKELTDDQLLRITKQIANLPVESVCLSGGEPLIRSNILISLVKELKDSGVGTISMTSNGMMISKEIVYNLAKAGMNNVQVSVDGLRDAHDWLRNKSGSFDKVMESIKVIIEAGLEVSVACIPNKKNFNDFEDLICNLDSMGVSMFRVQPVMILGRACQLKTALLSQSDYIRLSLMLSRMAVNSRMKIEWGDPAQHLLYLASGNQAKMLFIDDCGNISLSPFVPIHFGNVMKKTLKEYVEAGLLNVCTSNDELRQFFGLFGSSILMSPDELSEQTVSHRLHCSNFSNMYFVNLNRYV